MVRFSPTGKRVPDRTAGAVGLLERTQRSAPPILHAPMAFATATVRKVSALGGASHSRQQANGPGHTRHAAHSKPTAPATHDTRHTASRRPRPHTTRGTQQADDPGDMRHDGYSRP